MRKICIVNQKGGVGKTTTAVNLATGLARRKKRVLVLDLDSQGNISTCLGSKSDKTMYDLLVGGVPPLQCVKEVEEGLFIISSDDRLSEAEGIMMGKPNRERILSNVMEKLEEDDFDFIILDCPPSLSLLNQNALLFSDEAIIPSATETLSFLGLKKMVEVIDEYNNMFDHDLMIGGILPTMYDRRNRICIEILGKMEGAFNGMTLDPIRVNSKLIEAPGHSKTIFDYAKSSRGAKDYQNLVDFVMKNE